MSWSGKLLRSRTSAKAILCVEMGGALTCIFILKFPAVLTHACCYVSVCNGIRYVGKVVWY